MSEETPPWEFVEDQSVPLCPHVPRGFIGACYTCRREHGRPVDVHAPVNYADRNITVVDELWVVEWHPEREAMGKPTQVHIQFPGPGGGTFAMRLKSKRAVDALISALEVHRNAVWPST